MYITVIDLILCFMTVTITLFQPTKHHNHPFTVRIGSGRANGTPGSHCASRAHGTRGAEPGEEAKEGRRREEEGVGRRKEGEGGGRRSRREEQEQQKRPT